VRAVHSGLDAVAHFPSVETSSFPGRWPQRLGADLVFNMNGAAPAPDMERMVRAILKALPPAVFDVDEQRQGRGGGDAADVGEHVFPWC